MATLGLNIGYYGSNENLIIFVHGLFSSKETWENKYGESIMNLLFNNKEIRDNYSLATFDYASKKIKQFVSLLSKETLSISELAVELNTELNSKNPTYKNIVVIGHSMGGLILKKYLCDNLHNNQVKIYISIATPHLGSKLANNACKILVSNKVQITDLKKDSQYLDDLNKTWISNKEKLPISYYIYGLNDKIVPKQSAIPNTLIEKDYIMGFIGDHSSIKEVTTEDYLFKWLLNITTKLIATINKKVLFINNTKKRLSEDIPINNYDDYCVKYALPNDQSIFKWDNDISGELKSKKKFKEFLKDYITLLTKIAKQADEIIYSGIPLIPLACLDGFHFKHITKQTNLVFYRKDNEWRELTNEHNTDQYNITPIDEIDNCSEINIALTSTFSSFKDKKTIIENFSNYPIIEYTAEVIQPDNITSKKQVDNIAKHFMQYIRNIKYQKGANKIHIFSSIPVPLAYYIGTKIETHDPDIILYHYENNTYPWGINIQNGELVMIDL